MMRLQMYLLIFSLLIANVATAQTKKRLRDFGISVGVFDPGKQNAITDVPGVSVGHFTYIKGKKIRTGVTAILPHDRNIFQEKVPAAIYLGNGFGKLAGYSQVEELGNIETPILLTNTLAIGEAIKASVNYTLQLPGNETVKSVNAIVGETNDGYLNDIRSMPLQEAHFLKAIKNANNGTVQEGNVGAGTGTMCFGFKGGIGTASRTLPTSLGGYTIGVLVQTNFGGVLEIAGVPVGKALGRYPFKRALDSSHDGSCMIVVITDAPLQSRNLKRLAKRAMLGLGKTGGIASNGSGDYVIAVSTHKSSTIKYAPKNATQQMDVLHNDWTSPLFMATIESTEEAILNSLFAAETMVGTDGHEAKALPIKKIMKIMRKYGH